MIDENKLIEDIEAMKRDFTGDNLHIKLIVANDILDLIRKHAEPISAGVDLVGIAHELGVCAASWEDNVRLLGNVRATDIHALCMDYLKQPT